MMQNQTNFNWAFTTCAMIILCKGYGWLAVLRFAIWRFNERAPYRASSVVLCLNRMDSNSIAGTGAAPAARLLDNVILVEYDTPFPLSHF